MMAATADWLSHLHITTLPVHCFPHTAAAATNGSFTAMEVSTIEEPAQHS